MTPEIRAYYVSLAVAGKDAGSMVVSCKHMRELLGLEAAPAPTNPSYGNPYAGQSVLEGAWQAGFTGGRPRYADRGSPYDTAYQAGVAARPKRGMQCPYLDAKGAVLFEGDTIRHPIDGSTATVVYDKSYCDESRRWRADYGDSGPTSSLSLQLTAQGGAVLFRRAGENK